MKFYAALFALMAVTSVAAAPAQFQPQAKGAQVAAAGKGVAAAKGVAAGAKAAKGSKGSAAAATATTAATATADNSTATATADNSTSVDNSASSNSTAATGTSSAVSATRTRPCDMGDQSLAGGMAAMVLIGIGQQASVVTLQNTTAAADFADGVTRLQQFTDTQSLQLQMAQGIADEDSFAQTQLKLLATSQTAQEGLIKGLTGDATTDAATLTQLAGSFLDSTNNAQDGAEQALIDCFIPLNAVSG